MRKKIDISKYPGTKYYHKRRIIYFLWLFLVIFPFIGFFMLFIGATNGIGNMQVQEVTVIEESKQSIKVQLGEELGDPIIYEMKKPIIFSPKEGDRIYIRYNHDKPHQLHYFINPAILTKTGIVLTVVPFSIMGIVVILMALFLFFAFLKELLSRSNLNIVEILIGLIAGLCFLVGFILMTLGSNESKLETIEIIGIVMFFSSCIILAKLDSK